MALTGLTSDACLALLEETLSDTTGNRWSKDTLYNFIDRSNKRLVRDTWFPDSRITFSTVADYQVYQIPLLLKTYRVYVAGQLAVPTDVPTLEGKQIWMWDESAVNGQAPLVGSDAPPGTLGPYAPQWAVQTPLSYPVANGQWEFPAPDAQPWNQFERPRYYFRGGYVGLVPPPANVVEVCIDCVRQPDTISADGQNLTTPENYLDAIVWGAVEFALFGDRDPASIQYLQLATQNREREVRKLVEWRWEYQGEQRKGPKPSLLRYRTPGTRLQKRGRC
jgi:hypothetical protein